MERHKRQFEATDDKGKRYTIDVFTEIGHVDGTEQDGPIEVEGNDRLATSDGLHVNYIKKGEYEIMGTGGQRIRIYSSSPKAY